MNNDFFDGNSVVEPGRTPRSTAVARRRRARTYSNLVTRGLLNEESEESEDELENSHLYHLVEGPAACPMALLNTETQREVSESESVQFIDGY